MVGAGTNKKSMAYVGNVAAFLAHALSSGPGKHVFNYVDLPDIDTNALVGHIRRRLGRSDKLKSIPMPVALVGGHMLDLIARLSGRTFPISAIRVRKFCENTQFRAERVTESGFAPPYSLSEALNKVIDFEFHPQRVP